MSNVKKFTAGLKAGYVVQSYPLLRNLEVELNAGKPKDKQRQLVPRYQIDKYPQKEPRP